MNSRDLPKAILKSRLIVVCRKVEERVLIQLEEMSKNVPNLVVEITMDSRTAPKDIERLRRSNICVGAGTVLTKSQAKQAIDAGAEFLVSPVLDEKVLRWSSKRGIAFIPGTMTPTEIYRASQLGASGIKVFHGSSVSPQYLIEARGPLGNLALIVTGGIQLSNAQSFIDAGAVAVGVGGWLTGASAEDLPDRLNSLISTLSLHD